MEGYFTGLGAYAVYILVVGTLLYLLAKKTNNKENDYDKY